MIRYIKKYYEVLGNKIIILLIIMQTAALIEGFGISLILPIIQNEELENNRLLQFFNWMFNLINLDQSLINMLIVLIVFFIFRAIILVFQSWFQAEIISNNLINMRKNLVLSLIHSDYKFINTQNRGTISNVLNNEIERVNFALDQLLAFIVSFITAMVYLLVALIISPVVTIFLAILSIPIGLIMLRLNRMTSKSSKALTDGSNKQQNFVLEIIENIKYLKSTGQYPGISKKMSTEIVNVGKAYRKLKFIQSSSTFLFEPLIVVIMAILIYFFTEVRKSNIIEILFLLFIFRQAAINLVATQAPYRKFISSVGSMEIYFKLQRKLDDNLENLSPNGDDPNFNTVLNLKNISYSYKNEKALNNISLEIKPKTTIAFVGSSGSGKSTTANIISSLLKPETGNFMMGEKDISDINLSKYREKIGYVTQESVVFNTSIQENISLWRKKLNFKKLENIIDQTGLSQLFENNKNVNDSGNNLSGGERQRLSLARELYRDSELLILDEATSSVDSILESQIETIISKQKNDKTIIIIAHRLSTIKSADMIYVFDNGQIVESGKFDELIQHNGIFTNLAKKQNFN
ncbi:MAG: ABC transporter ATP-binding protein [SAR202 cluster bacterium]|nr:ABC transporter ATP-binding protein [SAR202 cluster bacterium]|tara:strand:- start:4474 stop:6207 length:1734 start_codon:yes stop_codon:yes gene_type:complete